MKCFYSVKCSPLSAPFLYAWPWFYCCAGWQQGLDSLCSPSCSETLKHTLEVLWHNAVWAWRGPPVPSWEAGSVPVGFSKVTWPKALQAKEASPSWAKLGEKISSEDYGNGFTHQLMPCRAWARQRHSQPRILAMSCLGAGTLGTHEGCTQSM